MGEHFLPYTSFPITGGSLQEMLSVYFYEMDSPLLERHLDDWQQSVCPVFGVDLEWIPENSHANEYHQIEIFQSLSHTVLY